jgi:hypothetical protein
MTDKLVRIAVLLVFIVTACAITAQEAQTTTAAATETVATTTTAANTTNSLATEADSRETRERLRQILHRLPPEVGKVLKLDPSLWRNETFLKTYPALQAFVASHPEVAHNSRFYLEDIWLPTDPVPQTPGARMWSSMMEVIAVMTGVGAAVFVFLWLIRTLINQRRWSRLARVQTEVHTKLLDRFASNSEVMAYINTTAGRKFLEAAPIPLSEEAPRAISAPINRVLWSVQAGLVLFAAGIGMKLISIGMSEKEAAEAFSGFGILGMAIGGGFIASAIVSLMLSKRLGLWNPPTSADTADLRAE